MQLILLQKKRTHTFRYESSKRIRFFLSFFTFIHKKNSYKKLLFHSAGVLKIRLIQNISNRMYIVGKINTFDGVIFTMINLSKCDKINSPTVSPNHSAIIEVSVMCWHHY